MTTADHGDWLTVREAAQYIHVHEHTIYRWMREGLLRSGRPTRRTIRIRRAWIDDLFNNRYR